MSTQAETAFDVVIPARFASTRLPGKLLKDLAGRPMIRHVVDRALESGARAVHVATDDERIAASLADSGAGVVMTRCDHRSGTERLAEACDALGLAPQAVVVNVQGDEPLIPPAIIRQCAGLLARHRGASIATLCHRIEDVADVHDPNVVKVVFDVNARALLFSRAPIPFERDGFERGFASEGHARHFRHVGIYAYTAASIADYVRLPPAPAERSEQLEQLRALHHGRAVVVEEASVVPGPGVDTARDLERVRALMARGRAG